MERRYDISVLRIVSTLAVVFLHTCSTLLDNPAQFAMSNEQNLVFRIFSHSMRWAVPVFFIITGMLLLDSNRVITPKDCIKKYAFRIDRNHFIGTTAGNISAHRSVLSFVC